MMYKKYDKIKYKYSNMPKRMKCTERLPSQVDVYETCGFLSFEMYLTVADETCETRVVTLIILVRFDGVSMATTKLPVRALHALRVFTRELFDQDVGDRVDRGISVLPLPQLLQKPQVGVDQVSQSRKHTLEVRLA